MQPGRVETEWQVGVIDGTSEASLTPSRGRGCTHRYCLRAPFSVSSTYTSSSWGPEGRGRFGKQSIQLIEVRGFRRRGCYEPCLTCSIRWPHIHMVYMYYPADTLHVDRDLRSRQDRLAAFASAIATAGVGRASTYLAGHVRQAACEAAGGMYHELRNHSGLKPAQRKKKKTGSSTTCSRFCN